MEIKDTFDKRNNGEYTCKIFSDTDKKLDTVYKQENRNIQNLLQKNGELNKNFLREIRKWKGIQQRI